MSSILYVASLIPLAGEPIIDGMAKRTPGAGKGRPRRRRVKPLPNCRAVLICEKVIKDAFSGTISLVGVLTRLGITQFPDRTAPLFLFAQLANGLGKYAMTVEVQDDKAGKVIARSPAMSLNFVNRTEVVDIIFQVPPVMLTHAGVYTVAIYADGNEVAKQNFDTPPDGSEDASHAEASE